MDNDVDHRRTDGAEAREPRPVRAIGIAVILLLVLAIILLATGIIDMSPLGGP